MVGVSSPVALVQPQEVNPIPGQDEHETLEILFRNVDLSIAQELIHECFHTTGPGRPPRNPLGLFRAFIVMRMKAIRSLRELARLLDVDPRLRRLCLIEDDERGYPRSVLSRFTRRVGAERLRWIIDEKVVMLLRRSEAREVDVVLDASFIKAWSIRHPQGQQERILRPGCKGREARPDLRPRLQAPRIRGPPSDTALGQRPGAGEREREEARPHVDREDQGGPPEGWS
jgi:transposase